MDNTDAENLQTLLGVEAKEPLDKGLVTRLVLAVTIVALFVIFAVQNTESVTIEFLSWDFQLSQVSDDVIVGCCWRVDLGIRRRLFTSGQEKALLT